MIDHRWIAQPIRIVPLRSTSVVERARVQSAWIGCMSSGLFNGQQHLASILTDYAGLAGIAATRVESACASGGAAFRAAWFEVASGASDFVLAGGVEKMNDGADATYCLSTAADQEYEVYQGVTFPGLYAMIATAYMHKYGTTREELAAVAVKNHRHGARNPRAQFPRFPRVQDFASYARLVKCAKESAGKRWGTSGKKIGNPHRKWAFSEAAVLFLRGNPAAQRYKQRLVSKHGKSKALSILAHKLGRAVYYMLQRNQAFDMNRFLATR